MTGEQFKIFWDTQYPGTVPLGHHFKHEYPERWFRIHSLPESQRYPADQEDWDILLERQNTILTDLLTNQSKIIIVTGEHSLEGSVELHPLEKVESITTYSFMRLMPIDMYVPGSDEYAKGQTYTPMFTEQSWQTGKFNEVLKDIALWNLQAFFISIQNQCIISPYDGGMDIILKDSQTRDFYQAKYKAWLSPRVDGM